MQCLLKLPGEHGRCANISGFAGFYHIMQRRHGFRNRRVVIPAVDDVEINIHRPQAFETGIDLAQDRFARKPLAVGAIVHLATHFGSDDDFVYSLSHFRPKRYNDSGKPLHNSANLNDGINSSHRERIDRQVRREQTRREERVEEFLWHCNGSQNSD